ncbi:MAG: hypothetical protein O2951_01830 [Bacteroidetes bacterium]|nr:hypothetical protein [Bacteroidota bacterium]
MIAIKLFTEIIGLILINLHPFHVSISEMAYNQEKKTIEISVRMFLDDLELTLAEKHAESINVLDPNQKPKLDKWVEDYLEENLKIWVNDYQTEYDYLGSEIEGLALWTFIEISNVDQLRLIGIENNIMLEKFEDQIQLVHFSKEDQVRSLKLYKDHSYGMIEEPNLWK